jgi:hypothetical protein
MAGTVPIRPVKQDDRKMSETPEDRPEPTTVASESRPVEPPPAVPPSAQYDGPSRLGAVLAWVGIVAGVVFIVAVIFFAGFFLGVHARGYHGYHGHGEDMEHEGGPGGMMGPGQWQGPGGPGGMMGPGGMTGPGQQPPTVTLTVVPIPPRP